MNKGPLTKMNWSRSLVYVLSCTIYFCINYSSAFSAAVFLVLAVLPVLLFFAAVLDAEDLFAEFFFAKAAAEVFFFVVFFAGFFAEAVFPFAAFSTFSSGTISAV